MKYALGAIASLMLLAGCGREPLRLQGYAEGKFVMLAPESAGRLTAVKITEGAHVDASALLFQVNDEAEKAALDAARANAEEAAARFDDAAAGGRQQEVAAAYEELKQARATQTLARQEEARFQDLFRSGDTPRARLDEKIAALDSATARVAELRQRQTLVELPAREHQLRALTAAAKEAEAQAQSAADALRRRTVVAPAPGRVERVIRRAGDIAGPSAPAVRFLPDGSVVAVLFIPSPRVAEVPVGTHLTVACDGCPADLKAEITSIASEAEFTPPVIYSDKERARLVFRAEARFTGFVPQPGTPLRTEAAR
jgi:HlyD family secretion protein